MEEGEANACKNMEVMWKRIKDMDEGMNKLMENMNTMLMLFFVR